MNSTQRQVERLEAEVVRLRADQASMSAFFDHASDAFIVLDENRMIVSMNEAARQMTGFTNGEGLHCGDLFQCHDDNGLELRDKMCFGRCTLQQQESTPYAEMELIHRDGHTYPVSVSYSYIPRATDSPQLLMVMRDLTVKKRLEEEQFAKNELEITLKERERLSRDLHDGLVQSLAFLGLKSKMALTQMESEQYARVKNSLEEITGVINESYSEVRQALYDLRTPATEDLSGFLNEYLQSFSLQTKIETKLETSNGFPDCTNPRTSIHVLKAVQEAMTNVRKHAQATSVLVRLDTVGDEVMIAIDDNGRGFNVTEPSNDGVVHYGLTTMEERMELIGGRIEVRSEADRGTEVLLLLPVGLFR